jgi:hypothetical protein
LDTELLLDRHLENMKLLARNEADLLGDLVFAGGSVPQLYSLVKPTHRSVRPTQDIDVVTPDAELGRELKVKYRPLQLDVLCPDSLDDGRSGVSFLPDIDIAFHDFLRIELEAGLTVKVVGPVAFFVMKLRRAASYEFKRGSDLYDLLVVLEQYGAANLADRFSALRQRPEVISTVSKLAKLLADEGAAGYNALFNEMNIMPAQETWVIARFDQFFDELRKAGFDL